MSQLLPPRMVDIDLSQSILTAYSQYGN